MLALGLWDRFEMGLVLPVNLSQDASNLNFVGRDPGVTLDTGLGDLWLVPKLHVFDFGRFDMGLRVPVSLPIGDKNNLLGDSGTNVIPTLTASLNFDHVGIGVNAGYAIVPRQTFTVGSSQRDISVDDEIRAGLGLRFGFADWMDMVLDGSFSVGMATRSPGGHRRSLGRVPFLPARWVCL